MVRKLSLTTFTHASFDATGRGYFPPRGPPHTRLLSPEKSWTWRWRPAARRRPRAGNCPALPANISKGLLFGIWEARLQKK